MQSHLNSTVYIRATLCGIIVQILKMTTSVTVDVKSSTNVQASLGILHLAL